MKIHKGDLTITDSNKDKFDELKIVEGNLYISDGIDVILKELTYVSRDIEIYRDSNVQMLKLRKIGGGLTTFPKVIFTANVLEIIKGFVIILQNSIVNAEILKKVKGDVTNDSVLNAPILTKF